MDQAARARLMRTYAPRLLSAGVTSASTQLDDDELKEQEDPNETPQEELVEELLEMMPDVQVVQNPDGQDEDDPEPDGPDDKSEDPADQYDPGSKGKPGAKTKSKPVQAFYTSPAMRDVDAAGLPNQLTWTTNATTTNATTNTTNGLWNPVVTTVGARTFVTAPATVERASMWGDVPNPNPHILWMQGRFVGADRPNRNKAFWSSSDLEMGKPSVAHGPLNWLHEERHVIGAIADAKFVRPGGDTEQAAETEDPHIVALSAIWKWVAAQEAAVVQMASDAGLLAYSMECISEAVQCVGDNGCGQTVPFMAYAQGQSCAHLEERASVHRLVNPTFLGGAVIVPPTRPGWADADAKVMAAAAQVAEKSYEQAGRPDIPAATWEQLMAGVITFTQSP